MFSRTRVRWSIQSQWTSVCMSVCMCVSSAVIKPHITLMHPVVGSWLLPPNTSIHFIPAVTVHTHYPLHQPADSTRPHPPGHGFRARLGTARNHKLEKHICTFSLLSPYSLVRIPMLVLISLILRKNYGTHFTLFKHASNYFNNLDFCG